MINLSLSLTKSMSLRIICMLFFVPSCVFSTIELYRRCSQPFTCGDQSGLLYPFWIPGRVECGHPDFKLECNTSFAEFSFSSMKFRILEENYISGRIRLARSDFINNLCLQPPFNVSFMDNILPFPPNTELITIYYGCNFSREVYKFGGMLGCPNDKSLEHKRNYFVTRNLSSPLLKDIRSLLNEFRRSCERNVSVPASGPSLNRLQASPNVENLGKALRDGFELGLNKECLMCIGSGGACGYDQSSSGFICYSKELHRRCSQSFTCGNQHNLFYPFWIPGRENCGHPDFEVECHTRFAEFNIRFARSDYTSTISSVKYRILEANFTSRVIRLARSDYISNLCPQDPPNALFNQSILPFAPDTKLLTIYSICQDFSLPTYVGEFDCKGYFDDKMYYVIRNLLPPSPPEIDALLNEVRRLCYSNVSIPLSGPSLYTLKNNLNQDNLQKALEEGFKVGLNQECLMCMDSGGACGYDQTQTASGFVCYCIDEPRNHTCGYPNKGLPTRAKEGIGAASALMGVIFIVSGLFCVIRCQKKTSDYLRQQNLKALIPLKHYRYSHLKRITKSFAEVVGKGGFGTVYKGTLSDGHSVAVKILKESKGNGEDFINEVASMSKTSHVNIVSLLGFCSEGSKRAIIYEYLENGSLDQFISSNTMNVDWMALYGIALGVARGLEYLHHGCKTRIVHFDIKPQNILLDDNLCPKVSDFGLAKLCEKKESILSLLDTRGTIGYIAPEVFSRMYGRVSHKSDVYSYGMLLLEMIGARNKERFDQNSASNTSTMYFPEWIYKDLEKGNSGRHIEDGISNEDGEVTKKMTMVGLWCIQPSPSDRPAMNRVVEMMEGNLDAIEVPPRPVLQIPPVPLQESSTFSEDISVYTEE